MRGFNKKDGLLHADDIPLPALAQEYGTPLYVYSASQIRAQVANLKNAFARTLPETRQPLIAFACKANSNLAVLSLARTMDLGCDIVSGGELARALRAGIAPSKIVYSGVGKSKAEIAAALRAGILQINVESAAELWRIAEIAGSMNIKARICFRLNPDIAADTHDKIATGRREDKFGLSRSEIETLYEQAAKDPRLAPQGLHMHIGSQITNLEPFRQACEKLASLALRIKEKGLPLHTLDLGGGLGIVYGDETPPDLSLYADIVRNIIAPLETAIIVEPGRMIVGNAGILLTEIGYIKEHEQRRYAILDSGMNDLIRPALYGARHRIEPVSPAPGMETACDVVGPICESADIFAKNAMLPPLHEGDLLAVMSAGAYGFVMASHYNTRPLPAEILVDGARHVLIRQRESLEDILGKEHIPVWL